jgi:hypothetical protein
MTSGIRALTLSASAAVLLFAANAGTAQSIAHASVGGTAAAKIPQIDNPNWSGYSVYPRHGTLNGSSATWRVPQVQCESSGTQRVAVWVGLWGTNRSIKNGRAWLSQIGTDSQCRNGHATYFIVYQLYHSNAEFCAFLPNWIFVHVCKGIRAVTVMSPTIHANDEIDSFVSYSGKTRSGKLKFLLDLTDNTTGKYVDETVKVDAGTAPSDAEAQGGVIAEDNGDSGGLAKFEPLKLWLTVYTSASFNSVNYKQYEWLLKVGKSTLASNQNFKYARSQDGYTFAVRWNHWN